MKLRDTSLRSTSQSRTKASVCRLFLMCASSTTGAPMISSGALSRSVVKVSTSERLSSFASSWLPPSRASRGAAWDSPVVAGRRWRTAARLVGQNFAARLQVAHGLARRRWPLGQLSPHTLSGTYTSTRGTDLGWAGASSARSVSSHSGLPRSRCPMPLWASSSWVQGPTLSERPSRWPTRPTRRPSTARCGLGNG